MLLLFLVSCQTDIEKYGKQYQKNGDLKILQKVIEAIVDFATSTGSGIEKAVKILKMEDEYTDYLSQTRKFSDEEKDDEYK